MLAIAVLLSLLPIVRLPLLLNPHPIVDHAALLFSSRVALREALVSIWTVQLHNVQGGGGSIICINIYVADFLPF